MKNKFKLSRKRKKQYQKDCKKYNYPYFLTKSYWEWFYFKRRVEVRGMSVIILYPKIATENELLNWYKKYYPKDKLAQHYCKQLNLTKDI